MVYYCLTNIATWFWESYILRNIETETLFCLVNRPGRSTKDAVALAPCPRLICSKLVKCATAEDRFLFSPWPFRAKRCRFFGSLGKLLRNKSPIVKLWRPTGRFIPSIGWLNAIPNVKLWRLLGSSTPSKLWLKAPPNVRLSKLCGSRIPFMLWLNLNYATLQGFNDWMYLWNIINSEESIPRVFFFGFANRVPTVQPLQMLWEIETFPLKKEKLPIPNQWARFRSSSFSAWDNRRGLNLGWNCH